jgi:hypothetical protein
MQFLNKVLKILTTGINYRTFSRICLLILLFSIELSAQSTWHFRDGNLSATKRANPSSDIQDIKSFVIKWNSPYISGDITPLIGNIVQNSFPGVSLTEPLEICALMGDEILLLSGSGKLIKKQKLPEYAKHIRSFTVLFDSNETAFTGLSRNTCLIGSESIEFINPAVKEPLAHSYIFGYDALLDTVRVVKRLTIDLTNYAPNVSASIKPFYGRRVNGKLMVYATVDMSKPLLDTNRPNKRYPFFRGYTQFYDNSPISFFPLPDMGDTTLFRLHITGDVGFYQPSVTSLANNLTGVLFPYQQIDTVARPSLKNFSIKETIGGADYQTNVDSTYLLGFNINNTGTVGNFSPRKIIPDGTRPIIRPVYAELSYNNAGGFIVKSNYILVSEQYSGIDSSKGTAMLHLYTDGGAPITSVNPALSIPPLVGGKNHYWSVGVGNIDGNSSSNNWPPYYPSNPGNEIVVTQSTKEAIYPGSKLFIMRYNNGPVINKPIPPFNPLYKFDTICTSRVNGWLAAVADLDLADNKKEEIILVDGSKLMIMQLRDYNSLNYRLGYPFDTLLIKDFRQQTISNVAVADLEGDGKPEVVVTTFDSTYVLGSIIPNTLIVDAPNITGKTSYCLNDTIEIKWHNIILSQPNVSLKFERYDSSGNIIDVIEIDPKVFNNSDSVGYKLYASENLFVGITGNQISGKFIIAGLDFPDLLNDTSDMVVINKPELTLTSIIPSNLRVGDVINFTADVQCVDFVEIQYSSDNSATWLPLTTIPAINDKIAYSFNIPCLTGFFSCDLSSSAVKTLDFKFITQRNGASTITLVNGIQIRPKLISISIAPKQSANPSMVIGWNPSEITSLMPDSSKLSILISKDGGTTFQLLTESNVSDSKYTWEIPCDVQNNLIVRLCTGGGCFSVDTLVTDVAAKYVNILAPNPFNPSVDMMEFVYKIPADLNVTIGIYDQSNRLVRNIIKDSPKKACIIYTETWNGQLNDGSIAANGLYYLIVELSNGSREIYQVFVAK